MTQFKIGDVVRMKRDGGFTKDDPTRLKLVVQEICATSVLVVSSCKQRHGWVRFDELELVSRPDPQANLEQAIRKVLLSKDLLEPLTAAFSAISVQAIAKAVADELRSSWADRLVDPASTPKPAPWTPKVGDWVKVTKPVDCAPAHKIWWVQDMDQFDGKVMQVTSVDAHSPCATMDNYEFDFAWLALATDPRGQPAPTKRYREPTKDDLANGPIECEYRDSSNEQWRSGFLVYILNGSTPFLCVNKEQKLNGQWNQCQIEVAE